MSGPMGDTLVNSKGVPRERVEVISIWGRPELELYPRAHAVREELGWEPRTSTRKGLAQPVSWYRENRATARNTGWSFTRRPRPSLRAHAWG